MSRLPTPGVAVRGSSSGRPIMAALDLLGRRWTLRILWELRDEAVGFRALAEQCGGLSTAVLRERLVELLNAGIVEQDTERRYELTQLGTELINALAPLDKWSTKWARVTKR
jgi:DNA-binding HxlR family transcriptional regulator